MKHSILTLALAFGLLAAPPAFAANSARDMYNRAQGEERAVRSASSPSQAAVRRVVAAYERIVLKYPASGYSDNALWHSAQASAGSAGWTGFTDLGGVISEDPAVAMNADGRLEAFVRGNFDNALWHIAQTSAGGAWGSFTSLGGTLDGAIVPARNRNGSLDVFVRFPESMLWHIAPNTVNAN